MGKPDSPAEFRKGENIVFWNSKHNPFCVFSSTFRPAFQRFNTFIINPKITPKLKPCSGWQFFVFQVFVNSIAEAEAWVFLAAILEHLLLPNSLPCFIHHSYLSNIKQVCGFY